MDTRKSSMNPDAPPFIPGSKNAPGGDDKDDKKKSVNQEIGDEDDKDLSESSDEDDTVEIAGYKLPKHLYVKPSKMVGADASEKTFILESMFPGYSSDSLARLLASCDGNLDEAISLLENYGPDESVSKNPPGTSQPDMNSYRGSSSS